MEPTPDGSKRKYPDLCGLRTFEMKEEHGLHVQMVMASRINVVDVRLLAERAGLGPIHVKNDSGRRRQLLGKISDQRGTGTMLERLAPLSCVWSMEMDQSQRPEIDGEFSTIIRALQTAGTIFT